MSNSKNIEYEKLFTSIKEQYPNLSKRLQQVAKYMLENPNEVAFGTVAVISKNAKVTPSTLIRFANAFEFTGFSEMQKLFQQNLLNASPGYDERIKGVKDDSSLGEYDVTQMLLEQLSDANAQAMNFLYKTINPEDLAKARSILSGAESIHVKAVRRSFPIASYLAYILNHIHLRCFLLDGVGGMYEEQERLIKEEDALVVVSFHPYADETERTVQNAIKKNVPIVLITDSPINPMANYASVSICVKEAEVHSFRSLTTTMCLVQALAISLIRQEDLSN